MQTNTTKRRVFARAAVGFAVALATCAACSPNDVDDDEADCLVVRQPPAGASTATLDFLLTPEQVELDGDTVGVRMSTYVELVDAPELPRQVSVKLGPSYFSACGDLDGTFRIRRAEVTSGNAVAFDLTDETTAAITMLAGGSTSVTLTGTYVAPLVEDRCSTWFPVGSEIPFTETVQVAVVEPTGVRWNTPVQPLRAAIGRRVADLSLAPVAADGHDINAINALPSRAVGIDAVFCDAEQEEWQPWDPRAGIQMPAATGTVTLRPTIGDALDIEVIDVADVSTLAVSFQVAGMAAGPLRLEDGGTYGPAWGRKARLIFAVLDQAEVDSTRLASDVPPEWFSLTTSPASTAHHAMSSALAASCTGRWWQTRFTRSPTATALSSCRHPVPTADRAWSSAFASRSPTLRA